MTRIPLTGGAYQAHSVIAAAQRQVNLFSEPMPQASTEPQPAALYPTPGLRLLNTLAQAGIRGGCQASNGNVYVVAGSGVYSVGADWAGSLLGSITAGKHTPVSMVDNGLDLVIVDGSANGWHVTLANNAFAQISDPTGSFRGGDRVDFLDTYFLFNVPGTPQFEASDSLALTFDPLFFANKEGFSDLLATLVVAKRQIWLLGTKTSEIFFNAGAADFPFQSFPNVIIDHGCVAKYSAAEIDNAVYWLAQDRRGQGFVVQGAGYETTRVSTFAIEQEMATYARIDDAIGFTYFLAGHLFYVLTFPQADKTWAYDISTKLWHEWLWIDSNGSEHRHRANCCFAARGLVVAGDWQNGNLYAVDPAVYTDNANPIKRLRAYPHMLADGKRVFYRQFLADMDAGTAGNTAAATAYTFTPVVLVDGAVASAGVGGTTPSGFATSFDNLLASFWVYWDGSALALQCEPAFSGFQFHLQTDGISFNAASSASAPLSVVDWTLPTGLIGRWSHVILSVKKSTHTAQLYINAAAQTPFINSWFSAAAMGVSVTDHVAFGGLHSLPGVDCCIADLFIDTPATFFDLTIPANLAKFIDPAGGPVSLGPTGALPTGSQPLVFLSVPNAGTGPDFLTNRGSAGVFTGTETIALCTDAPFRPPDAPDPGSLVFLSWSDDRGHSFGNPVGQSLGALGEYRTSLQWQRLGLARDRVFTLEWSSPRATALQGAWVTAEAANS